MKKEFLRHLGYKKVVLLSHGDTTRGQKELHWACDQWLMIDFQVGRGLSLYKIWNQGFQDLERLGAIRKGSFIMV